MKFRENRKINNSRALFRVNGVSIDSLEIEMNYKSMLTLSSLPEAQGVVNALKLRTKVKL